MKEVWYTEAELADALKSEQNAKIAISSCQWRYHATNKALRDAKVKQYQWLIT